MKVFALSAIIAAQVSAEFSLDKTLSAFLDAQDADVARAFSGQMGNTINGLNEYGCWCYFYEDHGRGKGQPIDAIDEMCKILHDGYECAMRDAEDEGTTCVPWEVSYTSAIGGSGQSVAEECATVNSGNNCAIRACTVEGSFVGNLLDAFIGGGASINNDNRHSNGFDVASSCATKKNGGGPSNKACCGNYPDRFPFKTIGGDRQCCGSRTYNALTLKCCDSDSSTVKFNC